MSRPIVFLTLAAVLVTAGISSVSARMASPLGGIPDRCVEQCPDGYLYATCTEDGHTIKYASHPCLTHQKDAAPVEECGPNPALCAAGRRASCIEGKWRCVKGSMAVSSAATSISIKGFNPKFARIGKRLTITGEGFARNGNVVHIGENMVRDVYSADGKTMTFLLPRLIKPACLYEKPMCDIGIVTMEPGTYDVYIDVEKEDRQSSKVKMTIIELR